MLDLNTTEWSKFRHAYGDASNLPELINELKNAPYPNEYTDEPWFTLWSSLCHQGSVYTGSFAAVPYLLDIAQSKEPKYQLKFIDLIASIHCFRTAKGQDNIPEQLIESYNLAVEESLKLSYELIKLPLSEPEALKSLLAAIATFKGDNELGAMLYWLENEIECDSCEAIIETPGLEMTK